MVCGELIFFFSFFLFRCVSHPYRNFARIAEIRCKASLLNYSQLTHPRNSIYFPIPGPMEDRVLSRCDGNVISPFLTLSWQFLDGLSPKTIFFSSILSRRIPLCASYEENENFSKICDLIFTRKTLRLYQANIYFIPAALSFEQTISGCWKLVNYHLTQTYDCINFWNERSIITRERERGERFIVTNIYPVSWNTIIGDIKNH